MHPRLSLFSMESPETALEYSWRRPPLPLAVAPRSLGQGSPPVRLYRPRRPGLGHLVNSFSRRFAGFSPLRVAKLLGPPSSGHRARSARREAEDPGAWLQDQHFDWRLAVTDPLACLSRSVGC